MKVNLRKSFKTTAQQSFKPLTTRIIYSTLRLNCWDFSHLVVYRETVDWWTCCISSCFKLSHTFITACFWNVTPQKMYVIYRKCLSPSSRFISLCNVSLLLRLFSPPWSEHQLLYRTLCSLTASSPPTTTWPRTSTQPAACARALLQ